MPSNSTYARGTKVGVDQSVAEIRKTLARFGATGFGFLEEHGATADVAVFAFTKEGLHVRMMVPMPTRRQYRTQTQYEQATRERFRAVVLTLKSKLVCINEGIESFQQSFLPYIVIPGEERTVEEAIAPQLASAREGRQAGPLLLSAPHPHHQVRIEEVEEVNRDRFET